MEEFDLSVILEGLLDRPMPESVRAHLSDAIRILRAEDFEANPASRAPAGFFEIPGYRKRYAIDSGGNVFSYRKQGLLIPWQKNKHQRHQRLDLRDDEGKYKKPQVHELVMAAFIGPRPQGAVIRHLDDDPTNNRLDNLEYGSVAQNKMDAVQNGKHSTSFSKAKREEIWGRWMDGTSKNELARFYGCSLRTISKIITESYADD